MLKNTKICKVIIRLGVMYAANVGNDNFFGENMRLAANEAGL